ncbi:cupin domain-containing protein [Mucilaginibacter sp. AW1-3]
MDTQNAEHWIAKLNLQPHPEGGYYKEVYRSENQVSRPGSSQLKQACTSIYYLLEGDDYSGFHRLLSDELWYFHQGSPLHIHVIDQQGNYSVHELSDQPTGSLSVAIAGGNWFASQIRLQSGFVLMSCVVAPGFEFSEFEMAKQQQLLLQYPQHSGVITKLCR